ncbi:MAG: hypothetical protein AAGD10_19390 [Myxococcota bacterium]
MQSTRFHILHASFLTLALSLATACGSSGGSGGGMCTPGSATGCPSGQTCNEQGLCVDDGTTSGRLVIDAAGATACEVLLESPSAEVLAMTPGPGVDGALRARRPRYAVALAAGGMRSLNGGEGTQLDVRGSPAALSVRTVNCFDANGVPLPSASALVR